MTADLARCRFCGKKAASPLLVCWNTRDMEDWAVEGDMRCYQALAAAGGGERGMRRVDQLRADRRRGVILEARR